MRKFLLIVSIFGSAILTSLFYNLSSNKNSLQGHLNSWGITINTHGFKMTKFTTDKTASLKNETLEAKKDDIFMRIAKTNVENHQKLIDDRIYLLSSLFLPTTSPYPEVITNIISCADEFKPKEENVKNGKEFSLFAGERYNFGICSQDLIKYKAVYGIFDCDKLGVFEISIFGQNTNELLSTVKSFDCK